MLEKGFLASNLFYAMHAHTSEHVQAYLEALDETFAELKEALQRGDLLEKIEGQPARSGFQRLN